MIPLREEMPDPPMPDGVRTGVILRSQKTENPAGFSISPASVLAPRAARLNRRIFALHAGVAPDQVRTLRQVHGVQVVRRYRQENPAVSEPVADAQWTSDAGVALTVMVADCCPVVIVDVRNGFTGIAHAGWRGTADGVVESLWTVMRAAGADRREVRVWIGPCAGPLRYQVGPEVAHRFRAYPESLKPDADIAGRFVLDLRIVLVRQILDCGIDMTDVSVSSGDTIAHLRYHSFRRDHIASGRMAAYVVRPMDD